MDQRPTLEVPLPLNADYSRSTRKQASDLSREVEEVNGLWTALAARKAEFRSSDPATFDPDAGRGIVLEELKILQRDLAIRKELYALELAVQEETRALGGVAREKLKDQRSAVEEQLRGLGYEEIPPFAVEKHPDVISRSRTLHDLHRRANDKDVLNSLTVSIRDVEAALETVKNRILAKSV